ncbi:MAG: amylo-alpha-1,6-glucosidase [archaeon]|nr:amylo-alpha-1,6-glucosidase [archaeon]
MGKSKFLIKDDQFKDRTYMQKGFKSFLYRYIDSGFRTKWCGFWVPPIKIIDYYAYKVNGAWLDDKNMTEFVLEKEKAVHKYILKKEGLKISETVFAPFNYKTMISVLEIKNISKTEKNIEILLEAAINMRTKNENWHMREYNAKYDDVRKCIDIEADGIAGYARIGIGKYPGISFGFSKDGSFYKDHYPGEKQRCFIPGDIYAKLKVKPGETKKVPFIICGSDVSKSDVSKNYDNSINKWEQMIEEKKGVISKLFRTEKIETENAKINTAYSWSVVNLVSLIQDTKNSAGLFAGIPWFLRFWSRDILWSIYGLVDIGEFEAAKEMLKDIAKKYESKIPTVTDLNGNSEYYSDDTDPLFILAVEYYVKNTCDLEFEKEIMPVISDIRNRLKTDKRGIVVPDNGGGWMDSYERHGTQIEIQSLWIEALKRGDAKKSRILKKAMDSVFWNHLENFPKDTSTDKNMTINCTVPVMFNHFSKSRNTITLNRIEEEFRTEYGVRTRSPYSYGYDSSAYHKGASWGLTTAWTAAASFAQGMADEGLKYIESMALEVEENHITGMAECVDAENGKLCGAGMQTWSHAMFIHAIDRYMFGIDADLKKNVINITPNLPSCWKSAARFGKNIGYYSMNLRIDREKKRIELQIIFSSKPKVKGFITLPPGVKKIVANGQKFKGRTAKFALKKENKIVGYNDLV